MLHYLYRQFVRPVFRGVIGLRLEPNRMGPHREGSFRCGFSQKKNGSCHKNSRECRVIEVIKDVAFVPYPQSPRRYHGFNCTRYLKYKYASKHRKTRFNARNSLWGKVSRACTTSVSPPAARILHKSQSALMAQQKR
jgi:hypothetical protein